MSLTQSGEPLRKACALLESPAPPTGRIRLKGVSLAACEDGQHTWQGTLQVASRSWEQPRQVPWPGNRRATFQFAARCPTNRATPTRATPLYFKLVKFSCTGDYLFVAPSKDNILSEWDLSVH